MLQAQKRHGLVMQLLGPLVEISLIPESKLRSSIVPIFFDMLTTESENPPNDFFQVQLCALQTILGCPTVRLCYES